MPGFTGWFIRKLLLSPYIDPETFNDPVIKVSPFTSNNTLGVNFDTPILPDVSNNTALFITVVAEENFAI